MLNSVTDMVETSCTYPANFNTVNNTVSNTAGRCLPRIDRDPGLVPVPVKNWPGPGIPVQVKIRSFGRDQTGIFVPILFPFFTYSC